MLKMIKSPLERGEWTYFAEWFKDNTLISGNYDIFEDTLRTLYEVSYDIDKLYKTELRLLYLGLLK